MKCYFWVFCLMMIIVAVSSNGRRKKIGSTCRVSKECCSRYCRDGKCIKFGSAADDKGQKDPCRPNPCPRGRTCFRQQVQCFTFPCPPVAECKK